MNRLIVCTFCLLALLVTVQGRTTFSLEAQSEAFTLPAQVLYNFPIAAHGDLVIHQASDSNTYHIRRRDAQGVYQLVATNIDKDSSYGPLTNGKFVAAYTEGFFVWRLDVNYTFVDQAYFGYSVGSAKLFDDNTLVMVDRYNNLATYQYEQSNSTWNVIQTTEVPDLTNPPFILNPFTINQATAFDGNYFYAFNGSNGAATIRVFERQADLSWHVITSVLWANSSDYGVAAYNGNDTLVVATVIPTSDPAPGRLSVFSKVNGNWQQKDYTGADLGIDASGSFGGSIAFVNQNTLLLSAPTDSMSDSSHPSGKIYVLTRNLSGLWEPTSEIVTTDNVMFGLGVNLVDDWLITVGCNTQDYECKLYSSPICFIEPINVTCHDQQVSSCENVDPNGLYTLYNPQCGSTNTSVSHVVTNNDHSAMVEFTFVRANFNATCTATISCPVTPSVGSNTPNMPHSSTATLVSASFTVVATVLALFM